jgi:hypothetical protein
MQNPRPDQKALALRGCMGEKLPNLSSSLQEAAPNIIEESPILVDYTLSPCGSNLCYSLIAAAAKKEQLSSLMNGDGGAVLTSTLIP